MDSKVLRQLYSKIDPKTKAILEKSPENKQYLLLLYFSSNENDKTFEVITGRTEARTYLIDNISDIDVDNSMVLVEDVMMMDAITVLDFLRNIQKFYQDDFGSILKEIDTNSGPLKNTFESSDLDSHHDENVNNLKNDGKDI